MAPLAEAVRSVNGEQIIELVPPDDAPEKFQTRRCDQARRPGNSSTRGVRHMERSHGFRLLG